VTLALTNRMGGVLPSEWSTLGLQNGRRGTGQEEGVVS